MTCSLLFPLGFVYALGIGLFMLLQSRLTSCHLQDRQKETMISCEKSVFAGCVKKKKKKSLCGWKSYYEESIAKVLLPM